MATVRTKRRAEGLRRRVLLGFALIASHGSALAAQALDDSRGAAIPAPPSPGATESTGDPTNSIALSDLQLRLETLLHERAMRLERLKAIRQEFEGLATGPERIALEKLEVELTTAEYVLLEETERVRTTAREIAEGRGCPQCGLTWVDFPSRAAFESHVHLQDTLRRPGNSIGARTDAVSRLQELHSEVIRLRAELKQRQESPSERERLLRDESLVLLDTDRKSMAEILGAARDYFLRLEVETRRELLRPALASCIAIHRVAIERVLELLPTRPPADASSDPDLRLELSRRVDDALESRATLLGSVLRASDDEIEAVATFTTKSIDRRTDDASPLGSGESRSDRRGVAIAALLNRDLDACMRPRRGTGADRLDALSRAACLVAGNPEELARQKAAWLADVAVVLAAERRDTGEN